MTLPTFDLDAIAGCDGYTDCRSACTCEDEAAWPPQRCTECFDCHPWCECDCHRPARLPRRRTA